MAERSPTDAIEIDYDPFNEFEVCGASYTPIYAGEPASVDPLTGIKYKPEFKGTVERIAQVCEIGGRGSGLRLTV